VNNPLKGSAINAVVAGGGGIGTAVAEHLLRHYPLRRLIMLQRSGRCAIDDERFQSVAVDATDPASIAAAGETIARSCDRLHLVFNAVGMLHGDGFTPEKRLKDVTPEALTHLAVVNAFFLPQLAAALAPLLRHSEPSIVASVSARVGSITDNSMGGWYSYRASKAAHNMLLKTLAREWRVSHKHCAIIALHPGTVQTGLSQPYTPANYKKRVLTPTQSAEAMLSVLESLTVEQTGSFYAWDGEPIPW
jgi:NAD(P)-dependent dehydrogenase (short-subunit alcohol dehydrogenase family)